MVPIIELLRAIVQGARDSLNAVLDIPVLSWAYKEVAHDVLSFMDLPCLVAAVPTTVIYTAVHGTHPFADDAVTDALVEATDFTAIQALVAPAAQVASVPAPVQRGLGPELATLQDKLEFAFRVSAFAASFGVGYGSAMNILEGPSVVYSIINAGCYLPYCTPDYDLVEVTTWDENLNVVLTAVSVVKTVADLSLLGNVEKSTLLTDWKLLSPWVEFIIDSVWMVPAVWSLSRSRSPQTICQAFSNVAFNGGGMVALPASEDLEPIGKAVLAASVLAMTRIYGVGMLVSSFLPDD